MMTMLLLIGACMTTQNNEVKDPNVWEATAYCSCEECCGKAYNDPAWNITASGQTARHGCVAINWLPFGTRVTIDGKLYTVMDRGAKSIFGSKTNRKQRVDIWFPTHRQAKQYGRKTVKLIVLD